MPAATQALPDLREKGQFLLGWRGRDSLRSRSTEHARNSKQHGREARVCDSLTVCCRLQGVRPSRGRTKTHEGPQAELLRAGKGLGVFLTFFRASVPGPFLLRTHAARDPQGQFQALVDEARGELGTNPKRKTESNRTRKPRNRLFEAVQGLAKSVASRRAV